MGAMETGTKNHYVIEATHLLQRKLRKDCRSTNSIASKVLITLEQATEW